MPRMVPRLAAVIGIALSLVACSSAAPKSQREQAVSYNAKHGDDAVHVRADLLQVQTAIQGATADPSTVTALATAAQQVHDDLSVGKGNFADVGGSGAVGDARSRIYGAVNDLKNSMGAIVAFAGDPNPATSAKMTTQYSAGVQEWNSAVTAIWSAAGESPPLI